MEKVLVITSSIVFFKVIEKMLKGDYEVSLTQEYNQDKVNQNDTIIIDSTLFGKEMLPSDKKFIVMFNYVKLDEAKYILQGGGFYIIKPFLKENLMRILLKR